MYCSSCKLLQVGDGGGGNPSLKHAVGLLSTPLGVGTLRTNATVISRARYCLTTQYSTTLRLDFSQERHDVQRIMEPQQIYFERKIIE